MSFERFRSVLFNAQQGHEVLLKLWPAIKPWLLEGHRLHLEVRADTRSQAQNALMWAMLTDLSQQIVWHGQKLGPEEFKDILTAALKRQKVVPGIDGGFVVLGQRTSKMTIQEMTELIDLGHAFGAEQGVKFSDSGRAA